jgi:hypothetical protein
MSACLFDLPNELIIQTFSLLPTTTLLPLASISRRIHSLVLSVLKTRLYQAATLQTHTLLLECYHPSQKLTEPPFYCAYVGTPDLDMGTPRDKWQIESNVIGRLDALHNLYSIFTPYRRTISRRPHPAGDVPGSRTHPSSSQPSTTSGKTEPVETEVVRQLLSLEGHELFTQLCAICNIVQVGPRNGLFRTFVEVADGVIRVWRDWLASMSRQTGDVSVSSASQKTSLSTVSKGKEIQVLHRDSVQTHENSGILWIDSKKDVGLRLKVTEKKWRSNMPVLIHADEEMSVSYEIEYQGEDSLSTSKYC